MLTMFIMSVVPLSAGVACAAGSLAHDVLHPGYDRVSLDLSAGIPDGSAAGIRIGPLETPSRDGTPLGEFVMELDIRHPVRGDLQVQLGYDADNDGKVDVQSPVEFYLARTGGWAAPQDYACPIALDGVYVFSDEPPSGPEAPFTAFDDLPGGGSFYLTVADTVREDLGMVRVWRMYLASVAEPEGCSPVVQRR
jgi:hypothetical protein